MPNNIGPFTPGPDDTETAGLIAGDCFQLAQDIPDGSIDLIYTDPPYTTNTLYIFDWLGVEAPRLLRPGGLVFAYAGTYFLEKIMRALASNLTFHWLFSVDLDGGNPYFRARQILNCSRLIVAYSNGPAAPHLYLRDRLRSEGKDKSIHEWQQAVQPARYWIERVSKAGDLILDPFAGSGSFLAAARSCGRRYLGFEIDPQYIAPARARILATPIKPYLPGIEMATQELPFPEAADG